MSVRARQLYVTAESQIAALAVRLSQAGAPRLSEPCPGRQKLGDGTIGTVAAHTAENYHRIASFIAGTRDDHMPHVPPQHHRHRASEADFDALLARLESARRALALINQLGDERLDSVPPAGEIKFADGQRTLEQVVASLLKHQRHQVDSITAALT
jgi:hypothetical protein